MANKYSKERLENACQRACVYQLASYGDIKRILENNLDKQPIGDEVKSKIVPIPSFRFARNPEDYKSTTAFETPKQNEFMERLENVHPYSKHGNAMCGSAWDSLMADQIIEEEEIRLQVEKE